MPVLRRERVGQLDEPMPVAEIGLVKRPDPRQMRGQQPDAEPT